MEAAAGMVIHNTALRPIDMAQCASPLCVVSCDHCQGATDKGVSVESLVPYILVVHGHSQSFH